MRKVIFLIGFVISTLMTLPGNCQTSSIKNRVWTYVDNNGDTTVSMSHKDAKILLENVLHCEYSDSILAYIRRF